MSKAKHVLFVCGSRDYPHHGAIKREIQKRKPDFVMNGGGGDADIFSTVHAHALKIHVLEIEAIWEMGGRGGPIRNAMMTTLLEALLHAGWNVTAVAFSLNDPPQTKGTSDMVSRLAKIGINAEVVRE